MRGPSLALLRGDGLVTHGPKENMNWLTLFEAILGVGEKIVPMFIHNPKSQQVEGVIISTANGVSQLIAATQAAQAGPKPTA